MMIMMISIVIYLCVKFMVLIKTNTIREEKEQKIRIGDG